MKKKTGRKPISPNDPIVLGTYYIFTSQKKKIKKLAKKGKESEVVRGLLAKVL